MKFQINSSSHALASLLLLSLVFPWQGVLAAEPERETVNGILHVRNGSAPTGGIDVLQMKELWQVGGEDDEDILFGLIPRVCSDADGNVYVLDSQLNHVLVFSPEGLLDRTLFREGEGPGEVRGPRDMMVFGDGRVGVVQEFPGVVIFVDREGNPAGRLKIGGTEGGIVTLTGCDAAGDHFVMSGSSQSQEDTPGISNREYFLASFDDQGIEATRYCESQAIYDFNDFIFNEREHTPTFWWGFAAGADGRTCVAPDREKYAIHVFSKDGHPEMVIEREYRPTDRSDQEYEDTRQIYESALTGLPVEYQLITERQAAAIAYLQRGLRIRDNGSIWALSGRGIRALPAGVLAVFDVFDRDGEFIKQVEMRGPGDALKDGIFFAGVDRVVIVKGYMESLAAQFGSGTTVSADEDETGSYLEVICYKLEN